MPSAYPVSARINAERLVVLGWSRAILLQVANPLLAAGVAEHSAFREGPVVAIRRLQSTIKAMLSLTFGTPEDVERTVTHIRGIHRRVNGTLKADVGAYPKGTRYSAEDPDLVLWVHVTLLDSVMLAYDRLVAPLSRVDRDAFCREAQWLPVALGAREHEVPETADGIAACLERRYGSDVLAVGDDGAMVARAMLSPEGLRLASPLTGTNRLFTVGTLPRRVRELYGFDWRPVDARRLERVERVIRRLHPVLPRRLAQWKDARRAGL